jgi:hypothetical protein
LNIPDIIRIVVELVACIGAAFGGAFAGARARPQVVNPLELEIVRLRARAADAAARARAGIVVVCREQRTRYGSPSEVGVAHGPGVATPALEGGPPRHARVERLGVVRHDREAPILPRLPAGEATHVIDARAARGTS